MQRMNFPVPYSPQEEMESGEERRKDGWKASDVYYNLFVLGMMLVLYTFWILCSIKYIF